MHIHLYVCNIRDHSSDFSVGIHSKVKIYQRDCSSNLYYRDGFDQKKLPVRKVWEQVPYKNVKGIAAAPEIAVAIC